MPAGAARRYWTQQLRIADRRGAEQDFALLQHGCIAPVGNLRVKESLPMLPANSRLQSARFLLTDVVERHTDFLEYAQQMGAISGGATGAGGEAPKFLLRRSVDDAIWIDTLQDDPTCTDAHYLVKFPRGQRSEIDCDILRTEFHYYHELQALGIATIDTAGMQLHEGSHYPSLWLPRFDVEIVAGRVHRYGLESIASVLNAPPGAFLNHSDALRRTLQCLSRLRCHREGARTFDQAAFVIEWVKRDFLNVAFGNSDNHARNTALLKKAGQVGFAPVYDFAPMKADPEGIIRSLRWDSPLEEGGHFDWRSIALALADLVDADRLLHELSTLARQLVGLRERLQQRGAPERILALPAVGLETLDQRMNRQLADWGA